MTGADAAICVSLFTGDRITARYRGALLDAEFESAAMLPPSAAGTVVTLRDAMVCLRDHLITEYERARAAHRPDPPQAMPRRQPIALPPDLVQLLVAFAERTGTVEGGALPDDLAARTCEALAGAPKPSPGPGPPFHVFDY